MSELEVQESEFRQFLREVPFDESLRPAHQEELRVKVLIRFEQSRKLADPGNKKPPMRSPVLRRRIFKLCAISAAAVLLVLPWFMFSSPQSRVYGFEDFAATIIEAKTARFRWELPSESKRMTVGTGYYMAPSKFRFEWNTPELKLSVITIADYAAGKVLVLRPDRKTASTMNLKGLPRNEKPSDLFIEMREALEKNRKAEKSEFHSIGERSIQGKRALGFRRDSSGMVLWGDPKTGLPLQIDFETSAQHARTEFMHEFEFNMPLDKSLFDLKVPDGYASDSWEMDVSDITERDLIAAFKATSKVNQDKFPDRLDQAALNLAMSKVMDDATQANTTSNKRMEAIFPIARGFGFALDLPKSADAHYAGKGAKLGTADRPIFWYKPANSTKYRVLYGDLLFKDSPAAPQQVDAQPVFKGSPPSPSNKN